MRLAMDDAGFPGSGKLEPKAAAIHHMISYRANVNRPLGEMLGEESSGLLEWRRKIEAAAAAYAKRKSATPTRWTMTTCSCNGAIDPRVSGRASGAARMFRHILIDEMQDTNAVQIEIVEAIAAAGAGNLTAVGDDAQSIYRFRGADYDNILRFPERHPAHRSSSST